MRILKFNESLDNLVDILILLEEDIDNIENVIGEIEKCGAINVKHINNGILSATVNNGLIAKIKEITGVEFVQIDTWVKIQ